MSTITSLWQNGHAESLTPNRSHKLKVPAGPERTYISHAIAEGTPLATSVRLEMHGEIKLKSWMPFTAVQVIQLGRGFVWSARVQRGIATVVGSDSYLDKVGEMSWKLFGLIPVMSGTGSDLSRSAGDRFAIERILLPPALCIPEATWSSEGELSTVVAPGISPIALRQNEAGSIKSVFMSRWGNPDGGAFALWPFGGFVDEESTWAGYTIPSKLRIGWHFGTDRFDEGEFFRVSITKAEFK